MSDCLVKTGDDNLKEVDAIIGVIADDLTGANDIGIMFAKHHYLTHIYPYQERGDYLKHRRGSPRVVILDTESRLDRPADAYNKVYQATLELKEAGVTRFFNKTCSVFRGNIGPEFDAMLDALGAKFAIVVLGFPKNGRMTVDGIHYVHGRKLADSEFRHDPMHPMTESNLVRILGAQTTRKVASLDYRVIKQGVAILRKKVQEMAKDCNYLILDVTNQEDLATIASALKEYPIFCGSSALAEELPPVWGKLAGFTETSGVPSQPNRGILAAAGSLMPQTAAQIAHWQANGKATIELESVKLMVETERENAMARITDILTVKLLAGEDVLLYASNQTAKVEATKELGRRQRLTDRQVGAVVSATLAEIVASVVDTTGVNRLLVAGGETSGAVSARLGIKGMRVWKELKPGLPSCIALAPALMLLVFKSGSFGREDFFRLAVDHLRQG